MDYESIFSDAHQLPLKSDPKLDSFGRMKIKRFKEDSK